MNMQASFLLSGTNCDRRVEKAPLNVTVGNEKSVDFSLNHELILTKLSGFNGSWLKD